MKRLFVLILLLSLVFSLCSCLLTVPRTDDQPDKTDNTSLTENSKNGYEYTSSTAEPESSLAPEKTVAEIATLTELRDFLNESKENGIFELEFKYVGDPSEVNGETIAQISTACCVTWWCENGNEYRIIIYEYPGDVIAKAYLSGDTSHLSADELATLDVAEDIVEAAKAKADSVYELELLLHDAIAERVTYINPSTDVPDPKNPPRHLTAVGALIDKEANCQGYTDAFYLLATMAGFTVGRMNVYNDDGWHIVNTLLLDGEWYVVDVTFDDTLNFSDGQKPSYRLFNAGRDFCTEYVWGEEMEYNRLAEKSDENYFYFNDGESTDFEYKKGFDDVNELANSLVDEYLATQKSELYAMLVGEEVEWSVLSDALKQVDTDGVTFHYTIWAYSNGAGTYFIVNFAQN